MRRTSATSRAAHIALLGLCSLLGAAGCTQRAAVQLISLKDPYFPEKIEFFAQECVHHVEPGRDVRVMAHHEGALGEVADGTQQWLELRLFWRPNANTTPVNNSSIDVTMRLVVASDEGVLVYSGTGWVYPDDVRFNKPQKLRIETGRLTLETRSGSLTDFLGNARVQGTLHSKPDDAAAIGLLRDMEYATVRSARRE